MSKKTFLISLLVSLCIISMCNDTALADSSTNQLTLRSNSYIYNSKGKRVYRKAIKKDSKVKFTDKIKKTNKVRNYYIFKNPLPNGITNPIKENLYWLPYKKINKKLYYKVGKNKYIRCINVEKINQYYVYVPQATVTVADPVRSAQKHIYAQDKTGYFTSHVLKKGTNLIVDEVVGLEHSQPAESYHIKGTKLYVYAGNIVKRPRGLIKKIEMNNKNTFILLNKNTKIYDSNGNIKETNKVISKKVANIDIFLEADQLKYIWQSQENKVELFYHLVDKQDIYTHTLGLNEKQLEETQTNNDYIKAKDTKFIQGLRLIPTNTPEEAKAAYEASQSSNK